MDIVREGRSPFNGNLVLNKFDANNIPHASVQTVISFALFSIFFSASQFSRPFPSEAFWFCRSAVHFSDSLCE